MLVDTDDLADRISNVESELKLQREVMIERFDAMDRRFEQQSRHPTGPPAPYLPTMRFSSASSGSTATPPSPRTMGIRSRPGSSRSSSRASKSMYCIPRFV